MTDPIRSTFILKWDLRSWLKVPVVMVVSRRKLQLIASTCSNADRGVTNHIILLFFSLIQIRSDYIQVKIY
jgi:hypothetical protein